MGGTTRSAGLSWGYRDNTSHYSHNLPHQRLKYEREIVLRVVPDVLLRDRRELLLLIQAVVGGEVRGLDGITVKHDRSDQSEYL